jgi:hypothetical protein
MYIVGHKASSSFFRKKRAENNARANEQGAIVGQENADDGMLNTKALREHQEHEGTARSRSVSRPSCFFQQLRTLIARPTKGSRQSEAERFRVDAGLLLQSHQQWPQEQLGDTLAGVPPRLDVRAYRRTAD